MQLFQGKGGYAERKWPLVVDSEHSVRRILVYVLSVVKVADFALADIEPPECNVLQPSHQPDATPEH